MPLMSLIVLAAAQAATPSNDASQPLQVFIAPSGQPFRAAMGQPYPVAQWFAQADSNHDGKITSTEFLVDFMKFFDSLDTDHDGRLDAGEIARYETVVAPEVRGGSGGREGRAGGEGGGRGPGTGHRGHHRGGGFDGQGMPGGGGFSSRHFQDMDEGQSDSDEQSGPERDNYGADIGSFHSFTPVAGKATGGARFDLLGIPEPVSTMARELSGVVERHDALNAATQRFDALDTKGLGYLTLDNLPETVAERHKGR